MKGQRLPSGKTPPWRTEGWSVAALCLGLVAITWAVFGQSLRDEFVNFDDPGYVSENPVVARGLTLKGILWAFSFHENNWHPLTWISHELDCQLYGLHPGEHHLTNLLLHTATAILLLLVLREMTGVLWRSAFVAAVFAIHPLRVESVAWVAERKDVLCGLFFMLTIWAYLRYARHPSSPGRYGLVVLLLALGLMCKPMLVTLPVVLLLLDYWPLQRVESPRRLVLEKLPLLALCAADCVVTLLAQKESIKPFESYALPLRLGNALVSCMVYLGQMVYPAGLAVFYPYPLTGLPAWEVALAVLLLAGLTALAWRWRRQQPWMLVGWLWYLVMLLPVAGVIQVGAMAHADRYTYLPQIGIYMAVTWLTAEWCAKWDAGRVATGGLMTAVLVALMVCAGKQTAYWKDSETLWTHALGCTKGNYDALLNLGDAMAKKGKLAEAMGYYQRALDIEPDRAEPFFNLSNLLLQMGQADKAMAQLQKALQIRPNYREAQVNLATLLLRKGQVDQAIAHYQIALQISPDDAAGHFNLGIALLQKGREEQAMAQFQEASQIEPDNPLFLNKAAWTLATAQQASLRNGAKAVQLARRANDLAGGRNPAILGTLAAALAEAGQLSDAMLTAQKAVDLARAEGQQDLARELNAQLQRYQAGLPRRK